MKTVSDKYKRYLRDIEETGFSKVNLYPLELELLEVVGNFGISQNQATQDGFPQRHISNHNSQQYEPSNNQAKRFRTMSPSNNPVRNVSVAHVRQQHTGRGEDSVSQSTRPLNDDMQTGSVFNQHHVASMYEPPPLYSSSTSPYPRMPCTQTYPNVMERSSVPTTTAFAPHVPHASSVASFMANYVDSDEENDETESSEKALGTHHKTQPTRSTSIGAMETQMSNAFAPGKNPNGLSVTRISVPQVIQEKRERYQNETSVTKSNDGKPTASATMKYLEEKQKKKEELNNKIIYLKEQKLKLNQDKLALEQLKYQSWLEKNATEQAQREKIAEHLEMIAVSLQQLASTFCNLQVVQTTSDGSS